MVKPAARWRLSRHQRDGVACHRWGITRANHVSAWYTRESSAHRVETRTSTFSATFSHLWFQLVCHAADRCPGIRATTILRLFGNEASGGTDWRPRRYLYNGSFLWKCMKYRYSRYYLVPLGCPSRFGQPVIEQSGSFAPRHHKIGTYQPFGLPAFGPCFSGSPIKGLTRGP